MFNYFVAKGTMTKPVGFVIWHWLDSVCEFNTKFIVCSMFNIDFPCCILFIYIFIYSFLLLKVFHRLCSFLIMTGLIGIVYLWIFAFPLLPYHHPRYIDQKFVRSWYMMWVKLPYIFRSNASKMAKWPSVVKLHCQTVFRWVFNTFLISFHFFRYLSWF